MRTLNLGLILGFPMPLLMPRRRRIVTSQPGADHFSGPFHHRSTILSALGPDYALTWVTHHGSALARYSLNFGVPMEPEACELSKGLVLGRDGNINLRITPLGDVGCHNPPPLGARRPRRHTTARVRADHFPGPFHHRSSILSALGPDYAFTWVTHHGSAFACYSLNFGVPMEPEASELPKDLVLGRDENIHLRITPLGDVGCHKD
ncbi:unnamed protein product [Malus baccata var. baccata]